MMRQIFNPSTLYSVRICAPKFSVSRPVRSFSKCLCSLNSTDISQQKSQVPVPLSSEAIQKESNNTETSKTSTPFVVPLLDDPVISHFVNIIMKDGKKATAQRRLQDALQVIKLRTDSVEGEKEQSPVDLFKLAIQKAEPFLKIVTTKKGTKITEIPIALGIKQRRRRGILFIVDAAQKRSEKKFSERLANEILNVLAGTSSALSRKDQVHKQGIQNRANTR